MLYWRLQSKIAQVVAQIQTVKIFRQSTLHPFIRYVVWTKSVIIWQAFLGSEGLVRVFYCSSDGSNKKFASRRYIFRFYWCDNSQEINQLVNVKLYCSLLYGTTCMSRKPVSDLSMLVFCFRSHTFVLYLRTTKVHSNQRFQGACTKTRNTGTPEDAGIAEHSGTPRKTGKAKNPQNTEFDGVVLFSY